jgi:hypothetical protein
MSSLRLSVDVGVMDMIRFRSAYCLFLLTNTYLYENKYITLLR